MSSPFLVQPRTALVVLSCGLLASCVVTRSELQYLDSPLPDLTAVPPCVRDGDKLRRLEKGRQCMVLVRGSEWLSRVPMEVEAGERYIFSVPSNQFWYDKTERIQAPRVGVDQGIKRVANSWKRNRQSGWFAIMATTVAANGSDEVEFDTHDVFGESGDVTFAKGGQLALYPNDAYGPPLMRNFFYDNNYGQVWVRVERPDDDQREVSGAGR